MIVQGSNEPIVLEFPEDMTNVQDFSAVLLLKHSKIEQKTWRKGNDDVTINENVVTLGLTQEETMDFSFGNATLQIKWMMDGEIFTDESDQFIKRWFDKNILEAS